MTNRKMAGLATGGVLTVLLLSACMPMVNPGFISMQPRKPGAVDFQVNAGSGYPYLGWGSVHVEPYATEKLSVPIGLLGSYPGAGAARVGLRYRMTPVLTLGGGVGGGFFAVEYSIDGDSDTAAGGFGLVDLELGLGRRWGKFALSFAFRPTYVIPTPMAYLPVEFGFAFYLSKAWAFTLLVNGGLVVSDGGVGGGFGGGIGVFGHL